MKYFMAAFDLLSFQKVAVRVIHYMLLAKIQGSSSTSKSSFRMTICCWHYPHPLLLREAWHPNLAHLWEPLQILQQLVFQLYTENLDTDRRLEFEGRLSKTSCWDALHSSLPSLARVEIAAGA
mmetsp:Transcript_31373/g.76536  ORF Transcript_31373/g.76536 Transcript_31373/m.76536 type:complete len:123 (+) Transcript_31373:27-395(+)